MGPCLPPSLKLRRPEVQAPAKPWRRRVAGATIGAFGSVVAKDTPKHSRGASARGLSNSRPSQKDQGRRECRAIDAPAASRAKNEKHTSKSPRITPFSSGIPARMVLTVSFVLFPETGLSCLRHWRDAKSIAANLTPASGRQNDTTSPSAPCRSSSAYKRPSHPAPTFVTIAKRPSCGHETRRIVPLIWGNEQHRAHATNWHDGQITFRPQKKLSSAS